MNDGKCDHKLLKGVLIALVLAVAWCTFVAVVLVLRVPYIGLRRFKRRI